MRLYAQPLAAVLLVVAVVVPILQPSTQQRPDFHAFWTSGRWFREGLDPYVNLSPQAGVGNLNAPVLLPVFAALSFLPMRGALAVWTIFSVLAYAYAAKWIAEAIAPTRRPVVVCALLLSYATFVSLVFGQLTGGLTLAVTAGWLAARRGQAFRAGMWVGIAAAVKPFLGLFALGAAAKRSWSQLFGFVCGVTAVGLIGLCVGGVDLYRSWIRALGVVAWEWDIANASILGALERLLDAKPIAQLMVPLVVAPAWVRPLWISAVVAAIALIFWRRHTPTDRTWLTLITSALLVSPLGWMYYAPLAAGPAMAVYQGGGRRTRACLIAGYLCLSVPFPFVMQPHGALGTLAIGCVYMWGLLAWLLAAVAPSEHDAVTASSSSS